MSNYNGLPYNDKGSQTAYEELKLLNLNCLIIVNLGSQTAYEELKL